MEIRKKLLMILTVLTMVLAGCINTKDIRQEHEDVPQGQEVQQEQQDNVPQEQEDALQEQRLLLNGISLTEDIIRSVYRGNYTYEVLLYSLAVNKDENNLYKGYFSFDEDKGCFIFPLDKSIEVLTQVFGEREYSFEDVFDYDEESDIYYKNLDFGWNTGFKAENATADISNDKLKLHTKFELINIWHDVDGDPVPTAIAECKITYGINKSKDKTYLQFENMEVLQRLAD